MEEAEFDWKRTVFESLLRDEASAAGREAFVQCVPIARSMNGILVMLVIVIDYKVRNLERSVTFKSSNLARSVLGNLVRSNFVG